MKTRAEKSNAQPTADLERPPKSLFKGWEDVTTTARLLRERGVWGTARSGLNATRKRVLYMHDRSLDRRLGVVTCRIIGPDELTITSKNRGLGVRYEGTHSLLFRQMLAALPADLADFVLVDYGSGLGRALIVASQYNFKKIYGIEYSRELHEVAISNLENVRRIEQKCTDINPVLIDATEFEIPDGKCILYFYNPFEESVMREVLRKVSLSYKTQPRTIYLVYHNPRHRELFDALPFLRRLTFFRPVYALMSPYKAAIYKSDA